MSVIEIKKPKVTIDPKILKDMKTQTDEMGQVILHFLFHVSSMSYGTKIRIWPSSYLYDLDSSHVSDMVHCENITLYPEWSDIPPGHLRYFSLFFNGLPKSCSRFDFIEECDSEFGAFEVRNVQRNGSDVYFFMLA